MAAKRQHQPTAYSIQDLALHGPCTEIWHSPEVAPQAACPHGAAWTVQARTLDEAQ
jgi:hypothetical protein